jgi:CubicO group peptidase (beta-lactamase class C family)
MEVCMRQGSWEQAVGSVVDRAIEEQRIVGAVVLVAHRGEVVLRKTAGWMDREARRPMQPDAIFRLASVTKPVVSAAALALIESGRLSMDDPVTRWLPEFRPRLPGGEAPEITVRHLLTHTSGLSYGFLEEPGSPFHKADVSDGWDQPGLTLQQNLQRLAQVPLASRPGERWRYSLGLDVLGGLLEVMADRRLGEIVQQLVGDALGWRDTGFKLQDTARLATPYADDQPAPRRMADGDRVAADPARPQLFVRFAPSHVFDARSYDCGGGGMVGTADELLAFFESLRADNGVVVSPASSKAMRENQTGDLPIDLQGPGWGFGYGGAVLKDPAIAKVPHSRGAWQWGGVYGHCWLVDAAQELTMVTLTNTAIAGMMGRFPDDLRAAIYARLSS